MATNTKIFSNLAGEFLVAAELNRRHILCSVTYGAAKSADVFAFSEDSWRVVRIEVKSTDKMRGGNAHWPIGKRGMEAGSTAHVWVFVLLLEPLTKQTNDDCELGRHAPRFFVLTGTEVQRLAEEDHEEYSRKYQERHGEPYPVEKGVPQLRLDRIQEHEAAWSKIATAMKCPRQS